MGTSSALVTLLVSIITVGFFVACVLVVAVVGESLASETHPSVVQGLGELSRGRSLPPEAITGTLWGYVIAGLALGATALVQYLSNGVLGDPSSLGSVNSIFGFPWPAVLGVVMFGVSIAMAYALVYVIALFARCRPTSRGAGGGRNPASFLNWVPRNRRRATSTPASGVYRCPTRHPPQTLQCQQASFESRRIPGAARNE